jgi:hypothetical protein
MNQSPAHPGTVETRTLAEWLKEAAYIQRNAAWQGWAGAERFLAIKHMLRDKANLSSTAFHNWMSRINNPPSRGTAQ